MRGMRLALMWGLARPNRTSGLAAAARPHGQRHSSPNAVGQPHPARSGDNIDDPLGGVMKAKKALKRLNKVEVLLSNVIEQCPVSARGLIELLDSAKTSVVRAKGAV